MNRLIPLYLLFLTACTAPKISRSISHTDLHRGTLYEDKDVFIEVFNNGNEFKFYLYQATDDGPELIPPKDIKKVRGEIDPSSTKQNFGLHMNQKSDFIVGIVDYPHNKTEPCKVLIEFEKDHEKHEFLIEKENCFK